MQAVSLVTESERTNRLATDVRSGNVDVLALWAAVERFASQQAARWARAFRERAGVEESGLMQAAFLALVEALTAWQPERGTFLTMYDFKLKSGFTAACGVRTRRDKNDPINSAYRPFDEPVGDDEGGLTLSELIPDPSADVEQAVGDRQMNDAVRAALDQLPQHERAAIIAEFWCGQAVDRRTHAAAMRHLRHPSISRSLRPFYD